MKVPPLLLHLAVGVIVAGSVFVGLGRLAHVGDENERVQALQASAEELRRFEARRAGGGVSLCRAPLETAAAELAGALRTDALASGNQVARLNFEPETSGASVDLVTARLSMTLTGDDRSLFGFLLRASAGRHPVAVDRFEITPDPAGGLRAELEGRLLCRRRGA